MRTRLLAAGMVLVMMSAMASGAVAPAPMWEVNVEVEHPHSIVVDTAVGDHPYWYFTYKVVNQYDNAKTILPVARLTDDRGKVYYDSYAPNVLQTITDRTGYTYGNAASGRVTLEPGEKKRFVALFDMPDRHAHKLIFSISGLSSKRVEKRDGDVGVFSRVYKVEYTINGDQYNFTPDRLKLASQRSYGVFDDLKPRKLSELPDAPAVKLGEATPAVQDVPAVGAPSVDTRSPLALIPAGMQSIAYVNVGQLADAGLLQDFIDAAKESGQGPDPLKFFEDANLDPNKDIQTVAMGIADLAKLTPQADKPPYVLIISGKFDADAIAAAIKKNALGSEPTAYKGFDLLLDDDGDLSGVLDGKLLVAGNAANVKKMIDIYKGDAAGNQNASLLKRVQGMEKQSFWMTADVAIPALPPDQAQGIAMMAPGFDPTKIKNVIVTGLAEKTGMDLNLHLNCPSAAEAKTMAGGLKNAMNMLVMMAPQLAGGDPEAGKAINGFIKSIKLDNKGDAAVISMKITPEMIEMIKARAAQMAPGAPAPADNGGDDDFIFQE